MYQSRKSRYGLECNTTTAVMLFLSASVVAISLKRSLFSHMFVVIHFYGLTEWKMIEKRNTTHSKARENGST